MSGGSFAEAIHDGNPESLLRNRLCYDDIEPGFVETSELGEERGSCFTEIA
jgi:hypothetical protein